MGRKKYIMLMRYQSEFPGMGWREMGLAQICLLKGQLQWGQHITVRTRKPHLITRGTHQYYTSQHATTLPPRTS